MKDGIAKRLQEAISLVENGKVEGSLLLLSAAVSATAKLRYPKLSDNRKLIEDFFAKHLCKVKQ